MRMHDSGRRLSALGFSSSLRLRLTHHRHRHFNHPLVQQHQPRRLFSDHYSPMFPMRPSPSASPSPSPSPSSRQEESWLSRHSGKIGIAALVSAVFFFYSYYKSGRNRVDEEDALTLFQAVEPYEINEIRYSSQGFTREVFEQVTREAHVRFPSGYARYDEYVLFVKNVLQTQKPSCQMGGGHLLDRIVHQHEHLHNTKELPILFLLTLTNLGMQAPAADRADVLFSAATITTPSSSKTTTGQEEEEEKEEEGDEEETLADEVTNTIVQNLTQSAEALISTTTPSTTTTTTTAAAARKVKEETLSEEVVNTIVLHLAQTCQIPSEKQVKETGVQYPFKTYRIKTAQEMVQGFLDEKEKAAKKANGEQPKHQPRHPKQRSLTRQEFRELIVSSYVCAWAECYRS